MRAGTAERDPLPISISIRMLAYAELGAPTGTDEFSEIADACARGRADLANRGLEEDGQKKLRMFSTWEITKYLIPVAPAHFRRVLERQPGSATRASPKPKAAPNGSPWMRCCACGAFRLRKAPRPKNIVPTAPRGCPPRLCPVANFKGGVGKTSTCAHLAMSAALDGYKVLVIDLDSQGSMTSIFGGKVSG